MATITYSIVGPQGTIHTDTFEAAKVQHNTLAARCLNHFRKTFWLPGFKGHAYIRNCQFEAFATMAKEYGYSARVEAIN